MTTKNEDDGYIVITNWGTPVIDMDGRIWRGGNGVCIPIFKNKGDAGRFAKRVREEDTDTKWTQIKPVVIK